jgi:hypothetical protein
MQIQLGSTVFVSVRESRAAYLRLPGLSGVSPGLPYGRVPGHHRSFLRGGWGSHRLCAPPLMRCDVTH